MAIFGNDTDVSKILGDLEKTRERLRKASTTLDDSAQASENQAQTLIESANAMRTESKRATNVLGNLGLLLDDPEDTPSVEDVPEEFQNEEATTTSD